MAHDDPTIEGRGGSKPTGDSRRRSKQAGGDADQTLDMPGSGPSGDKSAPEQQSGQSQEVTVEGMYGMDAGGDDASTEPGDAATVEVFGHEPAGRMLDHYRMEKRLGKGGMGEVYLATDTRLHRKVAIKILPPELTGNATLLRRFLTEARSCAQLNHPNVAAIYALGEAHGQHYIVMELIEGGDLAKRIRERGAFGVLEATEIIRASASGIAAAHERKIIHRDIKPSNIMFTPDGVPKVMDFGLARMAEASIQVTAQGTILGTPQYMSPEQCQGAAADTRSDVYALGVTYYELLTGSVPFKGDTSMAIMYQHMHSPPPDLEEIAPDLPRAIGDIIATCLEKNPDDRYRDAGRLVAAIDEMLESAPDVTASRLTFANQAGVSRFMEQTQLAQRRAGGSAAVAQRRRLPRPEELPALPQAKVSSVVSSLEELAPSVRPEFDSDRLARITEAIDRFAGGQRGLPADFCARMDSVEARAEPIVMCRITAWFGVLDYQVEAKPWGPNDVLPAGVRDYGAGQAEFFPIEEVVQAGGNLFSEVNADQADEEEFRLVGALAPETSEEHGAVRPMISRRRSVRVQGAEEIRYQGALKREGLEDLLSGAAQYRKCVVWATAEDMEREFSASAREVSEQLQLDPSLFDPGPLIEEIRGLSDALRQSDPPNPPEVTRKYAAIFSEGPAGVSGHLTGWRTVRCLRAEMTYELGVTYRVRLTRSGQTFEAHVLPDGSVRAENLARDYLAAQVGERMGSAGRALWSRVTRTPQSEADWIVLLLFWGGAAAMVLALIVVIASC